MRRAMLVGAAAVAIATMSAPVASAGEGWVEVHGRYFTTVCASGGVVWCDSFTDGPTRYEPGVKRFLARDGFTVNVVSGWCRSDAFPDRAYSGSICS